MELIAGILFVISLSLLLLVTRQRRTLKRLHGQNAQMSLALDHVNAFIYIKDEDNGYTYANQPCLELFGIHRKQLPIHIDSQFFPPETVARLREIDFSVIDGQQPSLEEVEVREANGDVTVYLESKYPIPVQPGKPRSLVGISTDITELWTLRTRLEKQAWHDALTGLYNRRKLDQAFGEMVQQRQSDPFSLILMDLDHFKAINDRYGHDQGDNVLRQIAQILQQQCDNDSVYGRWGGEEFLILYPGGKADATRFAQQLRHAISRHHYGFDQAVTASFGISTSDELDSEQGLLIQADQALYRAKQQGRDCIESAPCESQLCQ